MMTHEEGSSANGPPVRKTWMEHRISNSSADNRLRWLQNAVSLLTLYVCMP